MILDFAVLAAGLGLLLGGGEGLVRGASALAEGLGIAPVLVGLTVVAFGTSAPELVVGIDAALRGKIELGFGNVVGSNIANVGLLVAIGALIRPLQIHRTLVVREIPMMLAASIAMLVLGAGGWMGGDGPGYIRADGLVLLLMFGVFLYYTANAALASSGKEPDRSDTGPDETPDDGSASMGAATALVVSGLVALVVGAEFTVRGSIALAAGLGVGEAVIGLTVVAVGTSLPELATTLSAARRGEGDLAVGNIVGSNIFNLLLIWGICTTLVDAPLPEGGLTSLLVMAGFALLFLPMALSRREISRAEGGVMMVAYASYIGWLVLSAPAVP